MKHLKQKLVDLKNYILDPDSNKENIAEDLSEIIKSIGKDGRTIKKYDIETQMPVGTLSLIFSPVGEHIRKQYQEGKEYQIINTKNGQVKGKVIFYFN